MSNTSIQDAPRSGSPAVAMEVDAAVPRRRNQHRSEKIADEHLRRNAIVYVRQSTQHQVLEHRESTARQYALADRAAALGWPGAAVEVIDEDQGHSGSSAEGRNGFQRLLGEVSGDRVGIILGLEMSRLARSCKDWHALLELCAIYRTLLADADGLYDSSDYNDRLLLGLKGTMSEAELHILKSRMQQGMWNKAERGEALNHPPIGYVRSAKARDGAGDYVMDPDEQVQSVVRLVFEQFTKRGSVSGLLRWLANNNIKLPARPHFGPSTLSGLIVCGRCGYHMLVGYANTGGGSKSKTLRYSCQREAIDYGKAKCQSLSGAVLESFVAERLLQAVSPASLELSLSATEDIERERKQLDWQQRRTRSRYEVEQARRRYAAVDPDHRLVARELERRWDEALRADEQLQAEYDRFARESPTQLSAAEYGQIQSLSEDLPSLWHASSTTPEDRQVITRLLLEAFITICWTPSLYTASRIVPIDSNLD